MPEPVNGSQTPTGVSPSSTPPSGTDTSATPAPVTAPWKAPDNAPAWARGLSAEQVLAASIQLEQQNQQLYGVLQQMQQPQRPAVPAAPSLADDDFATGAQVRGYLDQRATQFSQGLANNANQAASLARGLVEQQDPEPFKRWGREIDTLLQNVPKEQVTLDAVRQAVRIVKADHVDELAAERAERLAAERIPTTRSNGGAGTGSSPNTIAGLDSPDIPDYWKRSAAAVGIGERELHEFCNANPGMTPERFVEQFKKGNILTAVAESKVGPKAAQFDPRLGRPNG